MSRQDKGGAGMILNRGPPSELETSNKISNSGGTDMYIEHPYFYEGKYYANIDGEMIEITKEVAYAMNNFYRSSKASQSIRISAIRSQRISGKNFTRRLSLNMRKQRIRATKRRGRVPRNSMAIPIKRRTKRQHPFDN
jgi:hypothetical protein